MHHFNKWFLTGSWLLGQSNGYLFRAYSFIWIAPRNIVAAVLVGIFLDWLFNLSWLVAKLLGSFFFFQLNYLGLDHLIELSSLLSVKHLVVIMRKDLLQLFIDHVLKLPVRHLLQRPLVTQLRDWASYWDFYALLPLGRLATAELAWMIQTRPILAHSFKPPRAGNALGCLTLVKFNLWREQDSIFWFAGIGISAIVFVARGLQDDRGK